MRLKWLLRRFFPPSGTALHAPEAWATADDVILS
jgi:hypothetical protein